MLPFQKKAGRNPRFATALNDLHLAVLTAKQITTHITRSERVSVNHTHHITSHDTLADFLFGTFLNFIIQYRVHQGTRVDYGSQGNTK